MSKRQPSSTAPIITTDGKKTIRQYGIYRSETEPAKNFTPATLTLANQGITLQILIPKSQEELEADVRAWNSEPDRTLCRIREHASRIYQRHAVEVEDMKHAPYCTSMQRHDLGNGLKTYQLMDNAPPSAATAAEVLTQCDAVERASDPKYQLLSAIQLGRYYERMLVRRVEHRAIPYLRKIEREKEKGKKRRADTEPERAKRREAVYAAMDQQVRRRERLSFRRAMVAAASECHCSFEAIRKAKPVNRWTARRKRK